LTAVVDDHLLRDVLAGTAPPELVEICSGRYATTNLYYYRLCKSAAAAPREGRLLGGWTPEQRRVLMGRLVALTDDITIVPLRDITWRMAVIAATHERLSMLGAEALAAAERLAVPLCVAAEDDGPGIRSGASALGLAHHAIRR
jgi:hypothetical protein